MSPAGAAAGDDAASRKESAPESGGGEHTKGTAATHGGHIKRARRNQPIRAFLRWRSEHWGHVRREKIKRTTWKLLYLFRI